MLRLLLVEDEALVAADAQDVLEGSGFSVEVAESGHAAIEAMECRIDEFDGLVTDVRVPPGPNGWELARRARSMKPSLPVLYITGDSAIDWSSQGVPDSRLLQKPFPATLLLEAVSAWTMSAR